MSGNGIELAPAPPSSDTGSSSNGQTDASGHGDLAVDGRIIQLAEIIESEMRTSQRPPPRPQQIYRVPKMLHDADKGAYQPRFLSLGPYHRGDTATEEMRRNDELKPENLAFAVQGGGPPVLEYMKIIASIEADARSCYDSDVTMEWDDFCKMLLHDGFQLITLLEYLGQGPEAAAGGGNDSPNAAADANHDAVAAQGQRRDNNNQEACRAKNSALSSIGHDLMMLENQIPFFVVQRIYDLRYGDGGTGRETVAELAWGIVSEMMNRVPTSSDRREKFHHLVHLCHVYLKPSCLQGESPCRGTCVEYGRFRRATEYYEAGVKFRRLNNADSSARCPLLDVSFSNGVLRIAQHTVDDKTNYILRNVLAYEQRYHGTVTSGATNYVTAYVVFMSQLLSSPEDVALLSRRGIMDHMLGNDAEVCALFRGLAEGLVFDPASEHYLNPVGVAL